MFNENANPEVEGEPILVDTDYEMEMVTCPFCNGIFAVDATYLDQCGDAVHCPMCCMEVFILEAE